MEASKHVKKDMENFSYWLRQWDALHLNNAYSEPSQLGTLAILHSTVGLITDKDPERNHQLVEYFADEAHQLATWNKAFGRRVLVIEGVNLETMTRALDDRLVSDITVIGNGTFESVFDDKNKKRRWIDWEDMAENTHHLKLGYFIQRTCGTFTESYRVPFSTFTMADHSNIFGVYNDAFAPEDYEIESEKLKEEAKIQQITDKTRLDHTAILEFGMGED